MSKLEKIDGPNEGHNHFYNEAIPSEEVAGLEYAIRKTERSLSEATGDLRKVYEGHLASLKNQLEKAKAKIIKVNSKD